MFLYEGLQQKGKKVFTLHLFLLFTKQPKDFQFKFWGMLFVIYIFQDVILW